MDSSQQRRRSPRVPVSCPVTVRQKSANWVTEAEDIGVRGCRIALKHPLAPGALVQLRFERGGAEPPLEVVGQVAWTRNKVPFDAGICFVGALREGNGANARNWIDGLVAAHLRRVLASWPDSSGRLSRLSTVVVELGIPPTETLDVGEAALVRLARSGAPLSSLCRSREALEVLIRLLERGVLSASRPTPDPEGWKHALSLLADSARVASEVRPRPRRA